MTTFQELKQGNQSQSGTNEVIREQVMQSIVANNQEFITLKIKDEILKLTANWSISRKSMTYFGTITKQQYINITGSSFGFKMNIEKYPPYFCLSDTGRAQIHAGGNHFEKFMSNESIEIL